ncbi:MAG: DUF1326 domain-containing protein [Alphaproteobacteria bacterium]
MTWQMDGLLLEACSCRLACPCVLGPAEPDQGWCSGALTFSIEKGQSGSVDLSGRKVVWLIDLPKDFISGDGTVRLYIDDGADASQRQELEAIFSGKKGGQGAVLDSLVSTYLPTEIAPITIAGGDDPTITVGSVGQVKMERVKNQAGRTTTLNNTLIFGLIDIDTTDLARSDGSRFADPEMRVWDSWGAGSLSPFSWKT